MTGKMSSKYASKTNLIDKVVVEVQHHRISHTVTNNDHFFVVIVTVGIFNQSL